MKSKDQRGDPPFETSELRRELKGFLDTSFEGRPIGNYRYGVYAFFDYDGEPIYVGQTHEMIRTRIRRHLTNQRTDAVAMGVLDPFEVAEIEVWPLKEDTGEKAPTIRARLNAMERTVYDLEVSKSAFKAMLNEKEPPQVDHVGLPMSYRASIVSPQVREIRDHIDLRIARRVATISRLSQVISERQVQAGLRRTLYVQAKRLAWLAERRWQGSPPSNNDENDS
jgi:hypothetical protein